MSPILAPDTRARRNKGNHMNTIPITTTVRLDDAAREAVAIVIAAIEAPLRSKPTISDAIRAALVHAAATLPAAASATASND